MTLIRFTNSTLLSVALCVFGVATSSSARADCSQLINTDAWSDRSFLSDNHVFIHKVWLTLENTGETDCAEPLAYFTFWDSHTNWGETLWTTQFFLVVPALSAREIEMEVNYDSRDFGDSYAARYPKLSISAGGNNWYDLGYPQQMKQRK